MATTRKRTSGFSDKSEEVSEKKEVETLLEAVAEEILKEEKTEEKPEVVVKATPPMPVVIESIIPTEDVGPRFVGAVEEDEEVATPAAPRTSGAPLKVHPPKRHPRNVPKYTRHKQL
jgi:hypothetical protein